VNNKVEKLEEIISELGSVVLAYSGGVDSSLLLYAVLKYLGPDNVISVVVNSEFMLEEEYKEAIQISESIGATTKGIFINELSAKEIRENTPDSWFHSKLLFYENLEKVKVENDFNFVIDGMIMDDLDDYRPGLRARDSYKVRSVLQEAGLYKEDVRELSQEWGLSVWNKPANCSVLSRFEYNTTITNERINRVKNSEKLLEENNFTNIRVRDHGNLARIEVSENEIPKVIEMRHEIEEKLKEFGYQFVTLDLLGYKYGRMNETLDLKGDE